MKEQVPRINIQGAVREPLEIRALLGGCLKTRRGTEIVARIPSPSVPLPKGKGSGKLLRLCSLSRLGEGWGEGDKTRSSLNRGTI